MVWLYLCLRLRYLQHLLQHQLNSALSSFDLHHVDIVPHQWPLGLSLQALPMGPEVYGQLRLLLLEKH